MFVGCTFQTNIYGTFMSHKRSRHTPHNLTDFIPGIVLTTTLASPSLHDSSADCQDEEFVEEEVSVAPLGLEDQYRPIYIF
jgi:hypothetical protein